MSIVVVSQVVVDSSMLGVDERGETGRDVASCGGHGPQPLTRSAIDGMETTVNGSDEDDVDWLYVFSIVAEGVCARFDTGCVGCGEDVAVEGDGVRDEDGEKEEGKKGCVHRSRNDVHECEEIKRARSAPHRLTSVPCQTFHSAHKFSTLRFIPLTRPYTQVFSMAP